jgi:hypothetical protein
MARLDVGDPKKDQQRDTNHAAEAVHQPEHNSLGVAQHKASPQRVAQVSLPQDLLKAPTHGQRVSRDEHESAPFAKKACSQRRRTKNSHQAEEDLIDCSTALSPDKLIEAESLGLETPGHMYNKGFAKDSASNYHFSALPSATTNQDMIALAIAEESQVNSAATNPSTAQDAAQIWPQCQQPCLVCTTSHIAIPGSHLSQTCARISIVLRGVVFSAAHQPQHQSFLVPIDKYELSVLGWLIWSTFVHQAALESARTGVPRKKMCEKDYVYTEIGRRVNHINSPMLQTVIRTKHRNKSSFESWWNGNRNLKTCGGKRWLVITFPWDMGDVNISDASFGAMGLLFSLPALDPAQATSSKGSTRKAANSLLEEQFEHRGFAGESADDIRKPADTFSKGFNWPNSRDNPAFLTAWITCRRPTRASGNSNSV